MKINSFFRKIRRAVVFLCLTLLVPCLLSSCDEKMMDYEGPESVYFLQYTGMGMKYYNTSSTNLMNYTEQEIDYPVAVTVTGETRDYDRPYLIAAAEGTTAVEGVDYRIPSGGVIKAGTYNDTIIVKLLKNDKLYNESVKLVLTVVPNEYFTTDLSAIQPKDAFDPRFFELTFTSMMDKPFWWESYSTTTDVENGNLGFFTAKKISLINEQYNLTYADWLQGSGMTTTKVRYIYLRFGKYLIQQYRNHTPVLEDDGRLMWVTGCPWTSVVGQPWDGTFNPNY
ncbi:MAG: DUF4843 domain-containing protein [Prevotella sp.]|nr:DUF4843 domain-containing protein [Prevotella sp.]